MATEKRLIDANALRETLCDCCSQQQQEMCKTDPVCATALVIAEYPTVDAVEVVRCKDCIHYEYGKGYAPWCNHMCGLDEMGEDDFCSYGERIGNAGDY